MTELSNETETPGDEPYEWEIIIHGTECNDCGEFGRPRVVKQYPDGRPHPRPYRHITCENDACPHFLETGERRHWKSTIPSSQLARRPFDSDDSRNS